MKRGSVLECASPLALSTTHDFQSARGLAHSKTCRQCGRFMVRENIPLSEPCSKFEMLLVTALPSILKPLGFEPPIGRVLAVDAGSRCIRLLLLESRFGKLGVL